MREVDATASTARSAPSAGSATSAASGAVAAARRPALDGLRALAVAAVVVYHFGAGADSVLPGGFLGVDVFFVLSGYLITGLLLAERRRTGRIALRAFWLRRIRRLLPAACLVLLTVSAWVWWTQAPETWAARRADLLWTLAHAANWHLIAVSEDYFAGYAGASPLRHAWSLAVEEQFYAVWPLLVAGAALLAARWSPAHRRTAGIAALGAGIVASAVALGAAYSPGDLSTAYYATQGRVQELLVGALLAVLLARGGAGRVGKEAGSGAGGPARAVRAAPAVVALAGLAVAMLVLHDDDAAYYRGGALAVAALTAVVVAGVELAPQGALARALSLPAAVALGRISYGVYLWHWPVLVALPVPAGAGAGEAAGVQALRLAVTLAAAAASFRFVEQPVLEGRVPWVGLRPGRVALAAVVAIAVTGTTAVVATRLPGALGEQFAERGDRACPGERPGALVSCVRADGGPGAPTLAVLGDSTARALAAGLDEAAPARGLTWVQAAWQRCTATGLLVVPNGSPEPDAPARTCHEKADAAIDAMLARNRPSVVLVAEFWSHHQPFLVDGVRLEPGTPAHAAAVRRELTGLVDRVSAAGGRTALLELPPPGRGLGASVAAGRPAGTTQDAGPPERLRSGYNAVLAGVAGARPAAAAVVSVTDVVCAAPGCGAVQDGVLVRTDRVHYSGAFSRRLAPVLLDRIDASPVGPLRARG